MATIINKIHGSSLLTTSINVPIEFGVKTLDTENQTLIINDNYKIVIDENNITSIIEFKTVPYIDYSKFDHERRRWFSIDRYDSLWRKYLIGDWIIELNKTMIYDDYNTSTIYFSIENLFKPAKNYLKPTDSEIDGFSISPFQPVTLTIEGVVYEDITDYSFNVAAELDYIAPDNNHQFYVKGNRIYTNTDLTLYHTDDIDIRYFYNISEIKVHNIMNTNSANYSNYTPVVDYYLVKLTGQ